MGNSGQFGLQKLKRETGNEDENYYNESNKIFFLQRKRNRIKREKGVWKVYRKTEIERRGLMN
jgi:DNA-binding phage protein